MPLRALTDSVDHLTEETSRLRSDVMGTREELVRQSALMRKQMVSTRLVMVAMFVVLLCSVAAAFTVSLKNGEAIAENNKKFCPLVLILVPQPGVPVATTTRGIQIGRDALRIAKEFGCL